MMNARFPFDDPTFMRLLASRLMRIAKRNPPTKKIASSQSSIITARDMPLAWPASHKIGRNAAELSVTARVTLTRSRIPTCRQ